jgi:hypothetical protein
MVYQNVILSNELHVVCMQVLLKRGSHKRAVTVLGLGEDVLIYGFS